MTCSGCGAEITDSDTRYCPQCGRPFAAATGGGGETPPMESAGGGTAPTPSRLTPRQKLVGALTVAALIIGGIVAGVALTQTSSGTTSTQPGTAQSTLPTSSPTSAAGEDAGSQSFPSGYPLASQVDSQQTQHIQQDDGNVQSHSCKYFAPALGPPPVYICAFKVDGVWHDNIQGTGHPDGSFSWQDDTSGVSPLQ